MRQLTQRLKKMCLLLIGAAIIGSNANATVFTAVVSGDFSASTTWGGVAPGALLTTDVVIIPSGITVTLTGSETFSGTSSILVSGTLASMGTGTTLIMSSGALSGAGTISVDSMVLGLTTGFTFTGTIHANKLTSTGASIVSAADITVHSLLDLSSGALALSSGSLTMGMNSVIDIAGGTVTASGTGMLNLDSVYSVIYTTASATTGAEVTGSGLTNITVNVPGNVALSNDLTVTGMLTLTSGTLSLNGHTLTFGSSGDLSATGTGTITGSATSGIVINTISNLSGALTFATGSNMVQNLTLNMGTASDVVTLGSALSVTGTLNLVTGKIKLAANNLSLATGAMLTGGTTGSYVVTDGTGSLVMNLAAGATDTFKVGSVLNYAPMVVIAGTGSAAGDVGLNVMDGVYSSGTTGTLLSSSQAMVNTTWHVTSTAATGIDYSLVAMWSTSMEVNGFNRTHAFLSHYTSSAWDASIPVSASVTGGMYTMTRTGITSLSPFMVTDHNITPAAVTNTSATDNDIVVYPNPATSTLHLSGIADVQSIRIYNTMGTQVSAINNVTNTIDIQYLPQGEYYISFNGKNTNTAKKFIKQ